MKTFVVLEPPDGTVEKVAFVKEGFSWRALVFTVLWALWHRMWMVAALMFAAFAVLTVAVDLGLLDPGFAAPLQMGVALIFGFEALGLQVKSLERIGFRRAGLIQASNREAAELTYFAGRTASTINAASSRFHAAHADTLGIFGNI